MAYAKRLDRLEHVTLRQARAYFDSLTLDQVFAWLDQYAGRPMREAMMDYLDQCSEAELVELSRPPTSHSPAWQRWHTHYEAWCAQFPFAPEETAP